MGIEGYNESRWILLDYGSVVIHLFDDETREVLRARRPLGRRPSACRCRGKQVQVVEGQGRDVRRPSTRPPVTLTSVRHERPRPAPRPLRRRARGRSASTRPRLPDLLGMVLPSQDAKFGDYQANFAMPLGKTARQAAARDRRRSSSRSLDVADLCEPPEIAGPGFINLRLKDDWLTAQLAAAVADAERLGVAQRRQPRTIVIDYSSPNVAKPMHVGHIRSTVIGDALYRILKFLGHRAISDNHLGDWGTQFGMIIYGYKHFVDDAALAAKPVAELSRLYRLVNALVEYHETQQRKDPGARKSGSPRPKQRVARLDAQAAPTDPKELKKAAKQLEQAKQQLAELQTELDRPRNKARSHRGRSASSARCSPRTPTSPSDVLLETAALHAGDPTNVELWRQIPARLPRRDRRHLRAARRHVRPHARRELLPGPAARRREGSRRQGPRPRERRRDLRLPRRLRRRR